MIFKGFLSLKSNGEEDDILSLNDEFLVELLEEEISHKKVSLQYYICPQEMDLKDAGEYFTKKLMGDIHIEYSVYYSEFTGYLWTDEELNIGGHDLLNELKSFIGKYLIMIVDYER